MIPTATAAAVIPIYPVNTGDVYVREAHGRFTRWRWACVWLTQLVFFGLPWGMWNARQAVLFDLDGRTFYIFGLVLLPQDFVYLALLLIICAYALFLLTTIAGRIWCGFSCPQTVYTEIFLWIEQRTEGSRGARKRLDQEAWTPAKLAKKGLKHALWILFSAWTGLTFVAYFTPIRPLCAQMLHLAPPPWPLFWTVFYGFATYLNAGWLREQICRYMCPYARFQSAMLDQDTLIVSYDPARGEPRKPLQKTAAQPSSQGACIDCSLCVQVCPTGIDIRNGLQHDCIGCAACVDACDSVMDKIGAPRGLIRFTTDHALKNQTSPAQIRQRILRPRTLLYTALLALLVAVLVGTLITRTPVKLNVIRDRGNLARIVDAGAVENIYSLQIMNADEAAQRYRISVYGMPGIALSSPHEVSLQGTESRSVPVTVRLPPGQATAGAHTITFALEAVGDSRVHLTEKARFFIPY